MKADHMEEDQDQQDLTGRTGVVDASYELRWCTKRAFQCAHKLYHFIEKKNWAELDSRK